MVLTGASQNVFCDPRRSNDERGCAHEQSNGELSGGPDRGRSSVLGMHHRHQPSGRSSFPQSLSPQSTPQALGTPTTPPAISSATARPSKGCAVSSSATRGAGVGLVPTVATDSAGHIRLAGSLVLSRTTVTAPGSRMGRARRCRTGGRTTLRSRLTNGWPRPCSSTPAARSR